FSLGSGNSFVPAIAPARTITIKGVLAADADSETQAVLQSLYFEPDASFLGRSILTITAAAELPSPEAVANPNQSNNNADMIDYTTTATIPIVEPHTDLQITQTVSDRTPSEGDVVTFTITAHTRNDGTNCLDAHGVVVREALSSGLTFLSAQTSQSR